MSDKANKAWGRIRNAPGVRDIDGCALVRLSDGAIVGRVIARMTDAGENGLRAVVVVRDASDREGGWRYSMGTATGGGTDLRALAVSGLPVPGVPGATFRDHCGSGDGPEGWLDSGAWDAWFGARGILVVRTF